MFKQLIRYNTLVEKPTFRKAKLYLINITQTCKFKFTTYYLEKRGENKEQIRLSTPKGTLSTRSSPMSVWYGESGYFALDDLVTL